MVACPRISTFSLSPLQVLWVLLFACLLPEVSQARLICRFESEETLSAFHNGTSPLTEIFKNASARPALPFHERASFLTRSIYEIPIEGQDAVGLLGRLTASEELAWAEIAPLRSVDVQPDDPFLDQLWALVTVEAFSAWDEHLGGPGALVAVIDTGVDSNHPDLQQAIAVNAEESGGSPGVDDDGNGWIDDVSGWDFAGNDANPDPEVGDQSHGTHVGGTVGAWTDNAIGVASIAWRTRLLPVRAGHGSQITHGVEGIWYAALSGASIINCSWGGSGFSHYEEDVIHESLALGALLVASAGNNGQDAEHYPGAYNGVLCVAATNPEDVKLSSSQYGWWVDLAAPGSNILSTVIGDGYAVKSGTSMSTPQVSSLCALVKDANPDYSPQQLREHVCFTSDNIDASNPAYAGLLGHGRINARRAMLESPRALELLTTTISDADGDDSPEPGEEIEIVVNLEALLGNFNSLTATLEAPDGGVLSMDMQTAFSAMQEGQSQTNSADPFHFSLSDDLEPGYRLRLNLSLSDGGSFQQDISIHLTVAPMWATLTEGELVLSLTDEGSLGAYDFNAMEQLGEGLRWPATSTNHLYAGSLLIALEDGRVASQASYLSGVDGDFAPLPGGEIRFRYAEGLQHVEASFEWVGDDAPTGLIVDLHAFASPEFENAVFVTYTLRNTGDIAFPALVPGLWFDLDIAGSWDDDEGGYDPSTGLVWQNQASGPSIGLALLDEDLAAFRLCTWGEWSTGGLEDDELNEWLRDGFQQTSSDGPSDYQACLGAASAGLEPGNSRQFSFCIMGADDVATLQSTLQSAQSFWDDVVVEDLSRPAQPSNFMMAYVAPNPFNPRTILELILLRPSRLRWSLYDVTGRRLRPLQERDFAAGQHRLPLDLSGLASGPYFLSIEDGVEQMVLPMTKLK
jgi:serine protease